LHQWVFPSSARPAETHPPGPAATAPVNPYLLTGRLTAELVVHKGESSSSTYRFAIRTKQSALTTGLAVGVVVLALFAVAYIESYIRTLRRGRSQVSGSFGLTLSAAAVGVAAVGAVWVLMGREPTIATLIGCGIIAAAAGVAATVGWLRVGTKYRYRRARRRSSH
jgi:predicted lysophospholipase L1 biosynthesis ABC-type transport system permease subunit